MNETPDIETASGLTMDEIQARLLVTVTGEDAAFLRRVVEENKALREALTHIAGQGKWDKTLAEYARQALQSPTQAPLQEGATK